ncbi:hypothetical protein [Bacillus thuringiensis]|uniref:hypothetical protein n=1 Tax=Bacillus thuringiensis TaxID=1428 RepID=UPI000BF65AEF|nr:hypothetical protein [Bacillus thuringiensis]PFD30381.1 hypothetical protein CN278_25795 [Bacillus thuringiensis]
MMMNHDELMVVNEKQTVIAARCIQCHTATTHNESRVCEECKEQDDAFYHGQKNELRSQISVMIQTLNEMKAVLNLVLDNKEMNQVHEIVEGKETEWHSKDSLENLRNGLYGEITINLQRLKL